MKLTTMALCLLLAATAHAEVTVDGRIDAAEWAGAQRITDFRTVQPLTEQPGSYSTEAWILPTAKGLAVAFRNLQPASVPRTRQRTQRDEDAGVDRVNLMVDFDADGGTGYNFTVNLGNGIIDNVISNENNFRYDWDGDWQHAVSEQEEGWSVEMLIPWHVAPMKDGKNGRRKVGIYLDRVVGSSGERVAWPALSFFKPRFLSDFAVIEMPEYSQSLLAVTPYAVTVADRVNGGTRSDAGADIFWKPSGRLQLTGTINPDYGQVESDELVVNFDAVETFFSDKRPFFTENQGLFDVPFGPNNSKLIYTRRVGGEADDGSGAADVRAALKVNGSVGRTDIGAMFADEGGDAGRSFLALRATHDMGSQDLGLLATQVRSPFRDRQASVIGLDHHWKPGAKWNVVSQFVASTVDQRGSVSRDAGLQLRINNERSANWRQSLYYVHLGDQLQLNDFGYLDRNNFNYLRYELRQRQPRLPADSSYSSFDWAYAVSIRRNDHGDRIFAAAQLSRDADTRTGGSEYWAITAISSGYDDLLTRGNGKVPTRSRLLGYYERSWARRGHWSFYGNLRSNQSGFEGLRSSFLDVFAQPTYHVNDALSVYLGTHVFIQPDWLLWQGGNLLGSFRSRQLSLNAGMQWSYGSRHELRAKLEAIALDARPKQAWRVGAGGAVRAVSDSLAPFTLQNLGFQLRYRYEIAPLSYVYAVYSRGGLAFEQDNPRDVDSLLSSAFSLRDSEQFLLKFSYRFRI